MSLDRYRLLARLGSGADGLAFEAEDQGTGDKVSVRLLAAARRDPRRWSRLQRRARLAQLFTHAAGLRFASVALNQEHAYIVAERPPRTLQDLALRGARPVEEVLGIARSLGSAVAEAHRLGLAAFHLCPAAIGLREDGTPVLDPIVADTGWAAGEMHAWCPAADADEHAPDPTMDVFNLGALLLQLVSGVGPPMRSAERETVQPPYEPDLAAMPSLDTPLFAIIREMLQPAAYERPTARDVVERLAEVAHESTREEPLVPRPPPDSVRPPGEGTTRAESPRSLEAPAKTTPHGILGRFRLIEIIGQGGMGRVYRAEDLIDGSIVAVKVLAPQLARKKSALRRFYKEARMLAEVDNPHIARFVEVNEDDGQHYLVMEYVEGTTLKRWLEQHERLAETDALRILADVARALADIHDLGIVHRDVKPSNVILVSASSGESPLRAKVCDFGVARHVEESESLEVTREGAFVGTPTHAAPEQFVGGSVDARTDVYQMGVTLYQVLAGQPPFHSDTLVALISLVAREPPPPISRLCPDLSEPVAELVMRMLEKSPERRPQTAREVLDAIERVLRGEPTQIELHPAIPPDDAKRIRTYRFEWDLASSPEDLWPHVSNTERLNRAVGLPPVEFTMKAPEEEPEEGEPRRSVEVFGKMRVSGFDIAWREHPFEWIEARRLGVLREYQAGPFKWFRSVVDLAPRTEGGTRLTHTVQLVPHSVVGRAAAALEVGFKARRGLGRVYRRIDEVLRMRRDRADVGVGVDPFEEAPALEPDRDERIERIQERLHEHGIEPRVAEKLAAFVRAAPAQEVARIRPLAFARRFGLPSHEVLAACLRASREGLLEMYWDILCPACRIAAAVAPTIRELRALGHCPSCNLDFKLDFARSIEMVFRVHPQIRPADTGTYCVGGPAHSPHVAAQVRLAPGERMVFDLSLRDGTYRLGGRQLPFAIAFRVHPGAAASSWEIALGRGLDHEVSRSLRSGSQTIVVVNDFDREVVLRLERTAEREDALTAAQAASHSLFRELFPSEVLSPGELITVARVALLITEVKDAPELYAGLGDDQAFVVLHEHFRLLADQIELEAGAVVKIQGDGLLASFHDPACAVRAAIALGTALERSPRTARIKLRIGVHAGAAMVTTFNDKLDYFGAAVRTVTEMLQLAGGHELMLSEQIAFDPAVRTLLEGRGVESELLLAGDRVLGQKISLAPPAVAS